MSSARKPSHESIVAMIKRVCMMYAEAATAGQPAVLAAAYGTLQVLCDLQNTTKVPPEHIAYVRANLQGAESMIPEQLGAQFANDAILLLQKTRENLVVPPPTPVLFCLGNDEATNEEARQLLAKHQIPIKNTLPGDGKGVAIRGEGLLYRGIDDITRYVERVTQLP